MASFNSMAAYVRMKLNEAAANGWQPANARPNVNRTATAFHILYELVPRMGSYSEALRLLFEELAVAVYQDFRDHEVNASRGTFFKLQPHFRKASKLIQAERDYISDIHDLESQLKRLRQEIQEQKHKSQALRDVADQSAQKLEELKLQVQRARDEIELQRRALKTAEEENESCQLRIQFLESQDHMLQINELKSQLSDARAQIVANNAAMERMAVEGAIKDERIKSMVTMEEFERSAVQNAKLKDEVAKAKDETEQARKRLAAMLDVPKVVRPDTPRPDWDTILDGGLRDEIGEEAMSSAQIAQLLRVHLNEVVDDASDWQRKALTMKEELDAFKNGEVTAVGAGISGQDKVKIDVQWHMVKKNMLTKAQTQAKPKPFVALGVGPNVPQYLQATGRIRNNMLGKAET